MELCFVLAVVVLEPLDITATINSTFQHNHRAVNRVIPSRLNIPVRLRSIITKPHHNQHNTHSHSHTHTHTTTPTELLSALHHRELLSHTEIYTDTLQVVPAAHNTITLPPVTNTPRWCCAGAAALLPRPPQVHTVR